MTSIAQKLQELAQEKQKNPQLPVIDKLLDLFPFLPEEGDQRSAILGYIKKFGSSFHDTFYEFCETAKNSRDFKALVETLDVSEAGQLIKNILYNAVCDQRRREPAIELSRTVSQTIFLNRESADKRFFLIKTATDRASRAYPYTKETLYYNTFSNYILKVAQWNWDIEEVLKKGNVPWELASFMQRSYFDTTPPEPFAADLFLACPQFKDKMLRTSPLKHSV
jgi:hypothetical protein